LTQKNQAEGKERGCEMKFSSICLSALPNNPFEKYIEAKNIKQARKIRLTELINDEEIDLDFVADLAEGKATDMESLYEYNLDAKTCRSLDTINDHDVFQVLEGINVYVIDTKKS
jgi:hypothetical protein